MSCGGSLVPWASRGLRGICAYNCIVGVWIPSCSTRTYVHTHTEMLVREGKGKRDAKASNCNNGPLTRPSPVAPSWMHVTHENI